MPFDSENYSPTTTLANASLARLIDDAAPPCPTWAAENPDRALALLFVAPRDCDAVDAIVSL